MVCFLKHRRRVIALCMFYKIRCSLNHALEASLAEVLVLVRLTRFFVSTHFRYLMIVWQAQFNLRTLRVRKYLNSLDDSCFAGDGVAAFKSQINSALLFG